MPPTPTHSGDDSTNRNRASVRLDRDKFRKAIIACDRCRVKKIKCDGTHPCRSCVVSANLPEGFESINIISDSDHGKTNRINCLYSRTARRYRGTTKGKTLELEQRLDNAERLLRTAGLIEQRDVASSSAACERDLQQSDSLRARDLSQHSVVPQTCHVANIPCDPVTGQDQTDDIDGPGSSHSPSVDLTSNDTYSRNNVFESDEQLVANVPLYSCGTAGRVIGNRTVEPGQAINTVTCSSSWQDALSNGLDERIISNTSENNLAPQLASNPDDTDRTPNRDELHGPNSILSICADPGVDWIASRIGSSTFATCATSFVTTINKKLKLDGKIREERVPEPSSDVAWMYSNAFFEESLEATYYTIDKANFESRLKEFHNNSLSTKDPAWYALRNVVYAVGCRIVTFKSNTWTEAQNHSQGYFENALAVEADLLHGNSGLLAVQALLLMALFAEGAGSAKLEYMLISCAARLGQARGLHLKPSSPHVSFEDAQRRSWIFWTIYCVEKHLMQRSGRPSAIDDDDISCELPSWAPDGKVNFVEWYRQIAKQAMLTAAITKSFDTVKARQRTLLEKAELVKRFDEELNSWYKNLPASFQASFPPKPRYLPDGVRIEHTMYLYLEFQGNLIAVHSIFGHPWNLSQEQSIVCQNVTVRHQVAASDRVLQETARNIILATRATQIDASAPLW